MTMAQANSIQLPAAADTFYRESDVDAKYVHGAHLTSYVPRPTLRDVCSNFHALCVPYHPIRMVRQQPAN